MSDTPAPSSPPAPGAEPRGVAGMAADASTLAATGLLCAVLFAVGAGVINFLGDPGVLGFQGRLLALTETVDVGDVALLGIAVALLLLTPDPPGGLDRPLLLRLDSGLAWIIAAYGVVRAFVLVIQDTDVLHRGAGFIATIGVAIAAATVGYYAARESFLKQEGRI
jgi:hypothetical protein